MSSYSKEFRQNDGYEYSVSQNDGWFHVRRKKINPKTGKGWQAGICLYAGTNKNIAMRAWLYGQAPTNPAAAGREAAKTK